MATAAGPFIGAALAEGASWRWAFWLVVPRKKYSRDWQHCAGLSSDDCMSTVSVITMAMIWIFVPLKPVEGNFFEKIKDMDWIGSVLSLAMTLCILVRLSNVSTIKLVADSVLTCR